MITTAESTSFCTRETPPVPKDGGELRNKCYMLITDLATYAQENFQIL